MIKIHAKDHTGKEAVIMFKWLHDNVCSLDYRVTTNYILFKNDEDALAFKIRFNQ